MPATTSRRRKAEDMPDPLKGEPQQMGLAPAPVAPAENDAARVAIATINTQLSEFDKVEAGLGELERKYKGVAYPVDTKSGMDDAVVARREIKGVRVSVEHARKAAKAPVLDLGRNIDAKAAAITARLVAIEDPIDDQIKAQETKEAERIAGIRRQIDDISGTPAKCIGKSVADLELVLEGLNTLPLETFAEFREEAARAQESARQQVQMLLEQAKQAAELARIHAEQKAEAARKASIQSSIDTQITNLLETAGMCRTSMRVQALIDSLALLVIGDSYQEFAAVAREEKVRVLGELTRIRDEKKAAEDARAAAAAAPAPTPAPETRTDAASWLARGAPVAEGVEVRVECLAPLPSHSSHDEVNDRAAADIFRSVGSGPGASLEETFTRVMTGPLAPATVVVDGPVVPSEKLRAILPPDFDVVDAEVPQRPSDAEILAVLADHYEVPASVAAGWLKTFDAAAALAQQSLLPTP